jgi:hypothetical protein
MPFVLQGRKRLSLNYTKSHQKDLVMNWIFETYSNVYNAALMQDSRRPLPAATAKGTPATKSLFGRLFHRS